MSEIKAIETVYNGYKFRSRLEARWAVFFDQLGIAYEYEPEGITLSDGTYYLPDFYLTDFHCYFEVKRAPSSIIRSSLPQKEFGDAIKKISDGSHTDSWAGLIAFGDPYDHYMWLFCQDISDGSAGSSDRPVTFGYDIEAGKAVLVAWNEYKDRTYLSSFHHGCEIPVKVDPLYTYGYDCYTNDFLISAELTARQARFEHGEKPKTVYKEFKYISPMAPIDIWKDAPKADAFISERVLTQMPSSTSSNDVYKLLIPMPGDCELKEVYLCKADDNGTTYAFADWDYSKALKVEYWF